MIKKSRPLDESEHYFVSQAAMEFVQLSFELDSPEFIPKYLTQIKNSIAGLHARCDRKRLYSVDREQIPVHNIPSSLKNSSLNDLNQWMYENHTPIINDHLAEIATDNESRIVINSSHICADGKYLSSIVQNIQSNEGLPPHPDCPGSIVEILKDEFETVQKQSSQNENKYRNLLAPKEKVTYLLNKKQDYKKVLENSKSHSLFYLDDIKNLMCYDSKQKKANGLTDHLWSALTLSVCARNGKLGPIGCNTCVDFRQLLSPKNKYRTNPKLTPEMTNFFYTINIIANKANKNMTIGELAQDFRSHFSDVSKNNMFLYSYLNPIDIHIDDTPCCHLSNIGPIKYESPIRDFQIRLQVNQRAAQEVVQIVTYSKLRPSEGKNEVHYQLAYSPRLVNDKEANLIFESFKHYLHDIPLSTKVGDALDELIKFQNKLQ